MNNVIEIKDLFKKYPTFELGKINLELKNGQIIGLIGENGAGKTTFIKSLLNIIKYEGKIKIFDETIPNDKLKENIGIVLDNAFFPEILSIKDIETSMKSIYKNWNTFACSLPNGRKNIVISKYISGIIMIFITSILIFIIGIILNILFGNIIIKELPTLMLISAFLVIIIESLIYPIFFKFGIEKGRYILFIGPFILAGLIAFISKTNNKDLINSILEILDANWFIILPLIAITMLIVSIQISKHTIKNKEF